MAKFSWGNLKSLKEIPKLKNVDPLEKMREFYKEVRRNILYSQEITDAVIE
jgi:secreted Zn-dependent insulinase-like peptidase